MAKKIIDISYYNGDINFAVLKDQVEFVIIRVQYGSKKIDPRYKEYVSGCQKYGIPFGFYAYGCYVSVADAVVEATDFYNRTKGLGGQFLVLDTEADTLSSCGGANLAAASQKFIDTLKGLGVAKVGFYTSHNLLVGDPYGLCKVKADFWWIPRYGPNNGELHSYKPAFPCDLWQYSENGQVAGTERKVCDVNVLTGSKPLEYFTGSKTAPAVSTAQGGGEPIIGQVQVIAENLNIRSGPGTNYPIIGQAPEDHVYNLVGNNNDWHKVILDDKGNKGFIFGNNGKYLSLIRK